MVDPRKDKSYDKNEWRTPIKVFEAISEYFEIDFSLDPCAKPDNHLMLPKFYTKFDNGLRYEWMNEGVYINPPFDNKETWIRKAISESKHHGSICVMLLPNFTDTDVFHSLIVPYSSIVFCEGRIRFIGAKGSPREGFILVKFPRDIKENKLN